MFEKILIANRGEIAVRIIKTCKRLGVKTVAVYSEADHRSPFVRLADEAVFVGGAKASESYLVKEKILEAAKATGAQAIHPGYGFLSENADFASSAAAAGIVFIGPPPDAVATLGDKMASKILAIKAGVPVVPGHNDSIGDLEEALEIAKKIGFPLLLKPAAGGGGRGMRIVNNPDEFPGALAACRDETRKGFADDRIFMERFIVKPRHIEIQIIADQHGNVVHLGERECSIQRRYQKVIEETPSPGVDGALRAKMGAVACALAKEAGYTNAGTVEFIMDPEKNFFFLEMNTRLQVEHPITEQVTNLDLVELQLRIASGEKLPFTQEEVNFKGWAIEARICSEDPTRGFLPTTGMITRYAEPTVEHVRIDTGVDTGSLLSIYYDSLVAKVASWGHNREEARANLVRALNGYHIEGLVTNIDFANSILNHPAFIKGELSTDFIEQHYEGGESKLSPDREKLHLMAIAAVLVYHNRRSLIRESLKAMSPHVGGGMAMHWPLSYVVRAGDALINLELDGDPPNNQWAIRADDQSYDVTTPEFEFYRRRLHLKVDDVNHMFRLQYEGSHLRVAFAGIVRVFEIYTPREWALTSHMTRTAKTVKENTLKCPMPGMITAVTVEVGANVQRGQELVRMESMKMESGIASPCDGRIEKILVKAGDAVETDDVLVMFGN